MDYEDYSSWKGWLDQAPFGELLPLQSKLYKLQLDRVGVPYKNINVLEVGFGNGSFISFLKENNSSVEGVEIQKSLLDAASESGIQVHNSISSVQNGPYDLIVAFDVLEHLTIEQLKALFKECRNFLKENGVMLFRFPNADSFAGMSSQNGDYTHITEIGQTKLQQLVEPSGFYIQKFEGEIVYPRRIFIDTVRYVFRYVLMHGMGVGSNYFFSGNVVAVVRRKKGKTRDMNLSSPIVINK